MDSFYGPLTQLETFLDPNVGKAEQIARLLMETSPCSSAKGLVHLAHPEPAVGEAAKPEDGVQHIAGVGEAVVGHLLVLPGPTQRTLAASKGVYVSLV